MEIFDSSELNTDLSLDLDVQEHLKMKNKFLDYSNLNTYRLNDARFTLNSIVSVDTDLQKIDEINQEIDILG